LGVVNVDCLLYTSYHMITSFPYIFTYVDLILYFSICSEPVYPTSPIDMFQWLPKEHMCVLVYLVSIIRNYRPEKSDLTIQYTITAL